MDDAGGGPRCYEMFKLTHYLPTLDNLCYVKLDLYLTGLGAS